MKKYSKKLYLLLLFLSFYLFSFGQTITTSNTAINGMSYIFDNGPSLNWTFYYWGDSLVAGIDVTLTSPTNFEISSDNITYSSTLTRDNTDGGLLGYAYVYVRMVSDLTPGTYTGNLTITGGGAPTATIALTGIVTPPLLTTPSIGTPENTTLEGFTANWDTVANCSGYQLNVYAKTTLIKSQTISNPSTNSYQVTDIGPSSTYTYTVIAIGDGVNYVNSEESVHSTEIETLPYEKVLLYKTDFTDWADRPYIGSASYSSMITSGAGVGFIISEDATIDSEEGKYWIEGSTSGRDFGFKPFDFISGGIIELTFEMTGSGTDRYIQFENIEAPTQGMVSEITNSSTSTDYRDLEIGDIDFNWVYDTSVLDTNKINQWFPYLNRFYICKDAIGLLKVAFYFPTVTGSVAPNLYGFRYDIPLRGISIYTSPGTTPYIDCQNIPSDSKEITLKNELDTSSNDTIISLKGYNLTENTKLKIIGEDSIQFGLSDTIISAADLLAGKDITITFNTGIVSSIKNASLEISNSELTEPVTISLIGITGTAPEILSIKDTIPFWTNVIDTDSKNIIVSGINLTNNITASITGTDAQRFSLSSNTIPTYSQSSGKEISITYNADYKSNTHYAYLTLSAEGAPTINIPLLGKTLTVKPELYDLNIEVSPTGAAVIRTNPAGNEFIEGTTVEVTITPDKNHQLHYWSDGKSGALATRTFTVSSIKNGTFTAFLKELKTDPITTSNTINIYPPIATDTAFDISWDSIEGASFYTITIYEGMSDTIVQNFSVTDRLITITGLTAGASYSYQVVSDNGISSAKVGPYTTEVIAGYNCGE